MAARTKATRLVGFTNSSSSIRIGKVAVLRPAGMTTDFGTWTGGSLASEISTSWRDGKIRSTRPKVG
jgi:hypothetical protein